MERLNCSIHLPLFLEEDSEVDVALNVIGIEGQGLLKGLDRLLIPPLEIKKDA
jgi:hypothetical protein